MDAKKAGAKEAIIAVVVLVGIGAFGWLTFGPQPAPPAKPTLTQEAKAYLPNLKLSEVEPQTSESYIQKSLFEIMGKITNAGPRTVTAVHVTCVFRDFSGKELKRELVSVVQPTSGPLGPNATKPFRLAFDDVPDEWNQRIPDFVIAGMSFQ